MFSPGPLELLLILAALVFIFGAKRLPEIGKQLGRVGKEFSAGKAEGLGKKAPADEEESETEAGKETPPEADLEAEIKAQLLRRMPGLNKVDKLKRTAKAAGKVFETLEKDGDKDGKA